MSLTSTAVSETDVTRSAKALMKEWLESYFDGGTHPMTSASASGSAQIVYDENGVPMTDEQGNLMTTGASGGTLFPVVKVRFDQSPSTQPMGGGEIRVLLTLQRQRDWADGSGRRAMVDAEWTLDVRAAVSGAGQANYLANRIGDLLYALLHQASTRYALAEKGVQVHGARRVETASGNDYAMRRIVARGLLHYEMG